MLQVYREKYSYVRTYINFTGSGSGVREILTGEPSLVEASKGKEDLGAKPKGSALGYCPGVVDPPGLCTASCRYVYVESTTNLSIHKNFKLLTSSRLEFNLNPTGFHFPT